MIGFVVHVPEPDFKWIHLLQMCMHANAGSCSVFCSLPKGAQVCLFLGAGALSRGSGDFVPVSVDDPILQAPRLHFPLPASHISLLERLLGKSARRNSDFIPYTFSATNRTPRPVQSVAPRILWASKRRVVPQIGGLPKTGPPARRDRWPRTLRWCSQRRGI